MIMTIMALTLGASVPLALPANMPAHDSGPASLRISVADYDFSNPADVVRFDRHVHHAVEEFCGTASSADLAGQNAAKRCHDTTEALIREQRDIRIAAASSARQALVRR